MKGDGGISLPKPVLKVPIPIFTSSIVLDFLKYLVSGIKKAISIVDQSVFVFFSSGSISFLSDEDEYVVLDINTRQISFQEKGLPGGRELWFLQICA